VNYVKTSNKLIGEIENNDLYASDELNDGFGATTHDRANMFGGDEDLRGVAIDFGTDQPKDSNKQFLKKMKSKREEQDRNQGIEQDVVNLGFVQNLAKKVSANQLAASGIQLSVRENLINFIKSMDKDKVGQNE
jgi:hypothetical protein